MSAVPNEMKRPGFAIKPLHILGMAIIVIAIALSYSALTNSVRPYTTNVTEAITSGRSVQLAGYLGTKGAYNTDGKFTFDLKDNTGKMVKVVYSKPKPSNFEQAVSIVAIGHYDQAQKEFIADDMLVKCPSKYQEQMDSASM